MKKHFLLLAFAISLILEFACNAGPISPPAIRGVPNGYAGLDSNALVVPSQRVDTNGNSNTRIGTLTALGDSITFGFINGSTRHPAADRYINQFATAKGYTEGVNFTNLAVSGYTCANLTGDNYSQLAPVAASLYTMACGTNDNFQYRTNAAPGLRKSRKAITYTGINLAIQESAKILAQNIAAGSLTGTWTQTANTATARGGASTTQVGATLTAQITGKTAFIAFRARSDASLSSKFKVEIDNNDSTYVDYGTYDAWITGEPVSTFTGDADYSAGITIEGLRAGVHNVRITTTQIDSGAQVMIHFIASNLQARAQTGPVLYLANTFAVKDANYTSFKSGLDNAIADIASQMARNGLAVVFVDVDSAWNPSIAGATTDSLHPSAQSSPFIARAFLDATNSDVQGSTRAAVASLYPKANSVSTNPNSLATSFPGGLVLPHRFVNADTTVTLQDHILQVEGTTPVTITFPSVTPKPPTGFTFYVNSNSTATITMTPQGANINGGSSDTITTQGTTKGYYYDGFNWRII